MNEFLGFLSTENAISLGGWAVAVFVIYYLIKSLRDVGKRESDVSDTLIEIISKNTEAITKLTIMLDERTRR